MDWKPDDNGETESKLLSTSTLHIQHAGARADDEPFSYDNCSYEIMDGRIVVYELYKQRYLEDLKGEISATAYANLHYPRKELASFPAVGYIVIAGSQ